VQLNCGGARSGHNSQITTDRYSPLSDIQTILY
jgi:hypothetical protein